MCDLTVNHTIATDSECTCLGGLFGRELSHRATNALRQAIAAVRVCRGAASVQPPVGAAKAFPDASISPEAARAVEHVSGGLEVEEDDAGRRTQPNDTLKLLLADAARR